MSEAFSGPRRVIYDRLVEIAAPVGRRYVQVMAAMQACLTPAEVVEWERYCLQLARCGWRTWESAEAFLTISPFLIQHLKAAQLWEWAEQGTELAKHSAEVATAFFQAAKPLLRQASQEVFPPWVAGGHWYLQHCPTRPSLAVEYFRVSPHVYGRYPLPVCALWDQLGRHFAQAEVKQAQTFFAISGTLLDQPSAIAFPRAWDVAAHVAASSCDVALHYLERYPDLLHRFGPEGLEYVHAIMRHTPAAAEIDAFLRLVGGTVGFVSAAERLQVLDWCRQIAAVSPAGMLAFLRHLPELTRRLPGRRLLSWVTTGIEVAQRHAEAGQAYFALESATAHRHLQALQNLVVFADVERVLQLYTEALLERHVELRPTALLPASLRPTAGDVPTTNGAAIFVPEQMDEFAEARENFAVYKVAILHQVGFYEGGTFTFSMPEFRRRVPEITRRLAVLGGRDQVDTSATLDDFFACFPHADLARRLFAMLEDARIDAFLSRRYKGIRQDLALIMRRSLQRRPSLQDMPLRQALLEGLLQVTLGGPLSTTLSPVLRILLPLLARRLHPVLARGATVYDTAVAVVDCYRLVVEVPARAAAVFTAATAEHLEAVATRLPDDAEILELADLFRQAGEGADVMPMLPDGAESAAAVEPVPYRGEIKPELIQKQLRLQDLSERLERLQEALHPMHPDLLKALLDREDLKITSIQAGQLPATSGLFVSDLEGREGLDSDAIAQHTELQQEVEALRAELDEEYGELPAQEQAVLYDEWDYLIGDYRRRWCCLTETVLPEGETTFVDETRRKYADLLTLIRRQFQLLRPEMFKKIKRLLDGEDIDLDSAVEAIVDYRAGNALSEKIYMRRNKRDRSVAALFLLDMSASTDDEVQEPEAVEVVTSAAPQPSRLYDFSGFVQEDASAPLPPPTDPPRRRIIDVEKEALVLMAEALEALGDAYAVYGFSGYGRDQVDFFIAKEFTDPYDARVQGRIAAIKPHRSTRMGPAIRHAVRKLERQEARLKTLVLLSDGYPQDYDYGKDRKSKDYGLQDTMMALHEAHLHGIQTFCITVDPAGHDYLREMCPDHQYLVIEDIASLPDELPKIYRGLTT